MGDVKPDNILLDTYGHVKLSDFGCCNKMKDAQTPQTVSCGSLYFQSYEKKYLSPIRYTTKSDIYSFGIMISECLNNSHCLIEHQSEGNVPYTIPLFVMTQYKDSHVIDFLNKCLDKNYNKRWSAEQLMGHSFLLFDECEGDESEKKKKKEGVNDTNIDDLEFMTEALISYYLHYNQSRRASKKLENVNGDEQSASNRNSFIDDIYQKTPIDDDEWTDNKRIKNIAKYCGYSVDAVSLSLILYFCMSMMSKINISNDRDFESMMIGGIILLQRCLHFVLESLIC